MKLRKLIIRLAIGVVAVFLAVFLISYFYAITILMEPLSVHITNADDIPHKVDLKVYYKGRCIFTKNLTLKPGKYVVIGNIAKRVGNYVVVITVDNGKTVKFLTRVAFSYAGVDVTIRNSTNIEVRQMVY